MLSRFHLIPERYGQTDRQTDGRTDRRTDLLYQCPASVWREGEGKGEGKGKEGEGVSRVPHFVLA